MMHNRLLVVLLCIGTSSALKGVRNLRRAQEAGEIINESFKAAAPPKDEPKVDPKQAVVKADSVEKKEKEEKEVKVKKVKTCRKIPKTLPTTVGDGSATTQQVTLPSFFGGDEEEAEAPVIIINDNALPPPPPPAVGEIINDSSLPPPPPPPQGDTGIINDSSLPPPPPPPQGNTLTTPLPPTEPEVVADANTVTEDDLPWCTPVESKVRSDEYCTSLLEGTFPDHKSLKGAVEMAVMYDESKPAVLENVKTNIKMKIARKVAGCKDARRRLQIEPVSPLPPPPTEPLLDVTGSPPPEPIYISAVNFGDFDVEDQCDNFESEEGCDKISADMEIFYEAPDNRDVTDEEAELIVTAVIDAIQLEAYEGAVVDGLSAEIQGSDRRVGRGSAGAIAGGTLTAAAIVAGVAVYKRYGTDIRAKWG